MRSPVSVARDFWIKHKVAAAFYDRLVRYGRPGGIDVSRQDELEAAALMHLLKHKHDVTVVRLGSRLTLMMKADVDRTFTPGVAQAMARSGVLANPGEDLIHGK